MAPNRITSSASTGTATPVFTVMKRRAISVVGAERILVSLLRRRTFWLLLICCLLTVICFLNYGTGSVNTDDAIGRRSSDDKRGGIPPNHHQQHHHMLTITGRSYESRMSRIKVYRCTNSSWPGGGHLTKPEMADIRWNNRDWQSPERTGLYLYSAFYDTRIRRVYRERHCFVRLLAMLDSRPEVPTATRGQYFCQLWLRQRGNAGVAGSRPVVTDAELTEIWNPQWDTGSRHRHYKPYLVSCAVPRKLNARIERISSGVMMHVSITAKPCERASSLLPVWYSENETITFNFNHAKLAPLSLATTNTLTPSSIQRTKLTATKSPGRAATFVVCVKPLDFDHDFSERLVEWVEMNLLLGASRIDVYTFRMHPNVARVLEHYNRTGRVRLVPATLPGHQPNLPVERSQFLRRNLWQKRRNELIPYNDCLYRNMYAADYVVPLDVDELLVPRIHRNWPELFEHLSKTRGGDMDAFASFSVRNAYFLETFGSDGVHDSGNEIEHQSGDEQSGRGNELNVTGRPQLYLLSSVYRSANFSDSVKSVKSFVRTDKALTVFNHYALETVLPGVGRSTVLPVDLVQMNHYRRSCPATMSRDCKDNFLKFRVRDNVTWKYREDLERNVRLALAAIDGASIVSDVSVNDL